MLLNKEAKLTSFKDLPEERLNAGGLMKELMTKRMERMLGAGLTSHLGCEEGKAAQPDQGKRRRDRIGRVLKGESGELRIAVPPDRDGVSTRNW